MLHDSVLYTYTIDIDTDILLGHRLGLLQHVVGLITTITHSSHCWHQQQHLAKISPIYQKKVLLIYS